jgi:hypothetical protein
MAMTPEILVALKNADPGKTDQELIETYNEVKRLAPNIESMSPIDIAKTIMSRKPQQVTVTGENPRNPLNAKPTVAAMPEVSTQLASPYAGTAMAQRRPETPGAAFINQFDPEQMRAAYEDYARRYAATAGQRQLGQGLAAAAGPEALRASQESWKNLDEQNQLMSLGQQKALQEQATQGLAAATTAQNISKTAGEYELGKLKGIQELEKGRNTSIQSGIDVLQRQKVAKPGTTAAKMAYLQLQEQARRTGTPLPPDVSSDTMSVEDMMPYMEPKLMKAWQDLLSGRKTAAETGLTGAQTGLTREQTRTTAGQADITGATAKTIVNPVTGQLTTPAGAVPSISAGGVNLSFPTQQVEAQAEGERRVDLARRADAWKNVGQPGVERVKSILNKGAYTGKGTAALASILGADDQVTLLTELARLNAIYPDMFPADLSASLKRAQSEGGYSGRLLGSMSQPVLMNFLKKYEEDMARQFSSGQARSAEVNKGVRSTDVPVKSAARPTIRSQAEYDALPKGSEYLDAQGNLHVKGGRK